MKAFGNANHFFFFFLKTLDFYDNILSFPLVLCLPFAFFALPVNSASSFANLFNIGVPYYPDSSLILSDYMNWCWAILLIAMALDLLFPLLIAFEPLHM